MARKLTDKDREEIRASVRRGVVVQEDPAISELVTLMEREADAEILGGTVTLRWGKKQIEVVKRAAEILGVPYQTYLKQVVFKQALEDIARAEEVLGKGQKTSGASRKPGTSKPAATKPARRAGAA